MKTKILSLFFLLLLAGSSFGQKWEEEYGTPLVVLTETNPWLMVIGSDVPTIAVYESGYIIYKRTEDKQTNYFFVKSDTTEVQKFVQSLEITDELSGSVKASSGTDQPTNILTLNFGEGKEMRVYGNLRSDKEARSNTPALFLSVYDKLIAYKNEKEQEWLPEKVEVLLSDYKHSPEIPAVWPEEWPNLRSSSTVLRSPSLSSVYLPKAQFPELKKLLASLKEKQAVEVNGKKLSVFYRFPFPNLR